RKPPMPAPGGATSWAAGANLELIEGLPSGSAPEGDCAFLLSTLDEVRQITARAPSERSIKAVIAPFIPSGLVPILAGAGILALGADASALRSLKGQKALSISPLNGVADG